MDFLCCENLSNMADILIKKNRRWLENCTQDGKCPTTKKIALIPNLYLNGKETKEDMKWFQIEMNS